MQRKIHPYLLIGFAILYEGKVIHGFSRVSSRRLSKRSTVRYLSEVRDLSSYEGNEFNALRDKLVKLFDGISQSVGTSIQDVTSTVLPNMLHAVTSFSIPNMDGMPLSNMIQPLSEYLPQFQKNIIDRMNLISLDTSFSNQIFQTNSVKSIAVISITLFISIIALVSKVYYSDNLEVLTSPYPDGRYNAATAKKYFDGRKGKMLVRLIEIGSASSLFLLTILVDYMR